MQPRPGGRQGGRVGWTAPSVVTGTDSQEAGRLSQLIPPPPPREGKAKAEQRTNRPTPPRPSPFSSAPSELLAAMAQASEGRGGEGRGSRSPAEPAPHLSRQRCLLQGSSSSQGKAPHLAAAFLQHGAPGSQTASGGQAGRLWARDARRRPPARPQLQPPRLASPLRLLREGRRQRRIGSAPRLPSCPPPPRPRLGIPTGRGRERPSRRVLPPGEGGCSGGALCRCSEALCQLGGLSPSLLCAPPCHFQDRQPTPLFQRSLNEGSPESGWR